MALSIDDIKKKHELSLRELKRLNELAESDRDSNGDYILNEYPYRVILASPLMDEKYEGLFEWLELHVNPSNYKREWVTRLYFKNEEDAVAFKLRWG